MITTVSCGNEEKTQFLIRLISNTFIHYHLQPNFLAGGPKSPGQTWQEEQLLLDSWTSVSLDRHSILLWGRGGGGPQAVTCLTQCIRDTLGLGKYNFDLGKRGYMKFLPRPD